METNGTPAGATPAAVAGAENEVVTAERVAAESGDFGTFKDAASERRQGKPRPDVSRPRKADAATTEKPVAAGGAAGRQPVAGRDGQPAAGPSDKDREADERLTARIKEAVDTSTAELRRKNQELEERLAASTRTGSKPEERTGATPPAAGERKGPLTKAEIAAYQAMPGAPKLDDKDPKTGEYLYESAEQHRLALGEFIRETRENERRADEGRRRQHAEAETREINRVKTFRERIQTHKDAHPERLVDNGQGGKMLKLSPEVGGLYGWSTLAAVNQDRKAKGLAELPATVDHAIAEELYDSEIPGPVGEYLSAHPEELATLRTATNPAQLTRMFGALEERVRKAGAPAAAAGAAPAADSTKTKPAADVRREAEEAVARSVSSTKPLSGNVGRGGGTESDPEAKAVESGDIAGFMAIQRQRRVEQLESKGRR